MAIIRIGDVSAPGGGIRSIKVYHGHVASGHKEDKQPDLSGGRSHCGPKTSQGQATVNSMQRSWSLWPYTIRGTHDRGFHALSCSNKVPGRTISPLWTLQ
eukprot:1937745-Amphidinium_carterae.1